MGEVMKSSKKNKKIVQIICEIFNYECPNVVHLHVEFAKIIYVHKCWIEYHVVLPPSKLCSFL